MLRIIINIQLAPEMYTSPANFTSHTSSQVILTKTLLDLHWLPIHQRILFKILILTYHRTAPPYLCDLIIPYSNARNLRSDNMLLIAQCHPRAKLKSYRERLFQYAAPTEWNKLPPLIRESSSLDIFKTQLKTFLFKSTMES